MKLTAEQLREKGFVEMPSGNWIKGDGAKGADLFPKTLVSTSPPKRIRQSSKPLMNKLEEEWFTLKCSEYPNFPTPRPQAIKLKIGNGAWYKGDVFVASWPQPTGPHMPTIWECKGPKQMKNVARGILTIKVAATQWPEFAFYLVWKDKSGHFHDQRVLP